MIEIIQNNKNGKQWLGKFLYLNYVGTSIERGVRARDQADGGDWEFGEAEVALDATDGAGAGVDTNLVVRPHRSTTRPRRGRQPVQELAEDV